MPGPRPPRKAGKPRGASFFAVPLGLRTARLLLILHCAGRRGITARELVEASGASKATVYRDLDRLRAAGWALDVQTEPGIADTGESRATYRLAQKQRVPALG
jgi:predicted DNA-binding transcriptional regulator YafY